MADYFSEVKNLQISLKDKPDQLKLVTDLVTNLQSIFTSSVTTSRIESNSIQSSYVSSIRTYINAIKAYLYNVNNEYSAADINAVVVALTNIIPSSPSRNAISNSLKEFNNNEKITFFNYNNAMKFLQNRYGDGLDSMRADEIIRDFIKQNTV